MKPFRDISITSVFMELIRDYVVLCSTLLGLCHISTCVDDFLESDNSPRVPVYVIHDQASHHKQSYHSVLQTKSLHQEGQEYVSYDTWKSKRNVYRFSRMMQEISLNFFSCLQLAFTFTEKLVLYR